MAVNKNTKIILITGCSSGIGRSLVEEFASRPNTFVYATARKLESIADLKKPGGNVGILPLDVTKTESVKKVVDFITSQHGRIDLLVNNAGMSLYYPTVEVPLSEAKRLFETNLFGVIEMVQQVAPVMVKNRSGVIVNVGSAVGVTATAYTGPYCASKAALHAWSDSLRLELAPLGVKVVVIMPGGITSSISDNGQHNLAVVPVHNSMYASVWSHVVARSQASQVKSTPTQVFARKMVNTVLSSSPPSYWHFGANSNILVYGGWFFPVWLKDFLLSRAHGLNVLRSLWQKGAYETWVKGFSGQKSE